MSYIAPQTPLYLTHINEYLPGQPISNQDLLKRIGESRGLKSKADWIRTQTGIENRFWANEDQACSDLAFLACQKSLRSRSGRPPSLLILSTISGDYPSPPTAPFVQHALGLKNLGTLDVSGACAGFIVGLHSACAHALAGGDVVLMCSSDVRSKFVDQSDLRTASLFGDGAAACFVEKDANDGGFRILASEINTNGEFVDVIKTAGGGSRNPNCEKNVIEINNGAELIVIAVRETVKAVESFIQKFGQGLASFDWLVPHQGNTHLISAIARGLGLAPEKVVMTVSDHGNTSGSTVGIALNRLSRGPKINNGDKILLCGAGGGGITGVAALEYVGE
ncbi:ketoacyl-ACP synthase III [Oligoflexaceae bacterium]|nr:ketoacyl-ACP synthase III [Oligoflexaceae bacterium]